MTRAEFIEQTANLLKLIPDTSLNVSYFTDVPLEHDKLAYINAAVSNGLINGDGNSVLRPDDEITLSEAVKIIVTALGYEFIAENQGGYPFGYMKTAGDLELISDINQNMDSALKKGDMCILFYQALMAQVYEKEISGTNEKFYLSEDTLLNKIYSLDEIKGVVTATYETSLNGLSASLGEESIQIDGVTYEIESPYEADLLGYSVRAYINTKTDVISCITADKARNSELVLPARDIENVKTDNQQIVYTYGTESGKERSVSIKDAYIIFNGQDCNVYDASDLMPESGYVTLIDNNYDGKYDVVKITSYIDIVVSNINKTSETVYSKSGSMLFDLSSDAGQTVKIFSASTGESLTIDDISPTDVLSIAESKANSKGKLVKIILKRDPVKGVVTSIDDTQVTLDNNLKYEFLPGLTDRPQVGKNVTLYINVDGMVVYFEKDITFNTDQYGILTHAYKEEGTEKIAVRIFNENEEFVRYECAERVKIDGVSYDINKKSDQILLQFKKLPSGGFIDETVRQLIRFQLNSDGKLTMIDTTVDNSEEQDDEERLIKEEVPIDVQYKSADRNFGQKFIIDDNTVIFGVSADIRDEQQYQVLSSNIYKNDARYNQSPLEEKNPYTGESMYRLNPYSYSEVRVPKVLMDISDHGEGAYMGDFTPLSIVKDVMTVYDEENDAVVQQVTTFTDGAETSFKIEDGKEGLPPLDEGDLILYASNKDGYLQEIEKIYDADGDDENVVLKQGSNLGNSIHATMYSFRYGKAAVKEGNVFSFRPFGVSNPSNYFVFSAQHAKIYKYNYEANTCVKGDAGSIIDIDSAGESAPDMIVMTRYSDTNTIIIFEE